MVTLSEGPEGLGTNSLIMNTEHRTPNSLIPYPYGGHRMSALITVALVIVILIVLFNDPHDPDAPCY